MRRILALLVSLIIINSLPCAFAQNNLSGSSDAKRSARAQQSNDDFDANDRAFWNSVKDSKIPDELRAYLEQFPNGIFAKLALMRLKVLETGSTESQTGNIAVSMLNSKEIGRDGRFVAYDNKTVLDTQTSLMWAANDNGADIEWADAKIYCESYTGGGYRGWRMPTQDELIGLFDETITYNSNCEYDVHLTKLINLSCYRVWASAIRTKGLTYAILGDRAADFNFYSGKYDWHKPEWGNYFRALPVRSVK